MRSSQAEAVEVQDPAGRLLELVRGLGVEYFHERSFRVCEAGLFTNRFLLSLTKRDIRDKRHPKLLDVCERMKMPQAFLESTERNLPAAAFVHFGFEENETACLYKVYLEVGRTVEDPGHPVLLHLAFKWDTSDPEQRVVTRYAWHPSIAVDGIRDRLSAMLGGREYTETLAVARGALDLAATRIGPELLQYLEVGEDENARRSFDLNVYDAGLRVRDFQPLLSRMRRRFAIPSERFDALYADIAAARFGHLAGGIHRGGHDFFNVYYGVEKHRA